MSERMPDYQEQSRIFNGLRDQIDYELRSTGFEEFLEDNGINPSEGRLVVARGFIYSSDLDGVCPDMDPFATRLITEHEVGTMSEYGNSRHYKGIVISSALNALDQEQSPVDGLTLDAVQIASAEGAITRLLYARREKGLAFLTKSLKKIDLGGD